MPVLIPALIGAGLATGIGVTAGTILASAAFAYFAGAFLTTLALSAASQALTKKPTSPSTQFEQRTQTVRTPVGPRQFVYGRVRTGGQLTYAAVIGHDFGAPTTIQIPDPFHPGEFITLTKPGNFRQTMNLVVTFTGHEVAEIPEVWFNDEVVPLDSTGLVTSGRYQNWAAAETQLGTDHDHAPNITLSFGGISPSFRQLGCSKVNVMLIKNNDVYPNGVPNISAVIKGKKVYDPRTGLTAWSDNPALCIADYLCTSKRRGGYGADYAIEINEPVLIAAANICDELVLRADGSTEKRYTLNGTFLLSANPQDIIRDMAGAMAGSAVCIGGKWFIRSGAWVEPDITLTDGDARGAIQVQTRVSRAEAFNAVKGVFTSPETNWQPSDFPPIVNAMYLAEDGGEQLFGDLTLPFTTSAAMAQRLAKISLERARQQITESFPGKLSCLRLRPGDTVLRTSADMGWVDKPFEVTNLKLALYNDEGNVPMLGVDLVHRETAAAVWDWNAGEETIVDLAPDTQLPNPFTPFAPGIASIVESLYQTTGSAGVKTRVTVTLGAVDADDHPDFGLEYQLVGVGEWIVLTSKNIAINIDDLAPGIYDFRARTFNAFNVASAYSDTTRKEIFGLTAPPSDVTNFSVRATNGVAWAMLDKCPDLDVIQGGRIVIRWSPNTSAAWNEGSLLSAVGYPGDSTLILLPLYGGTYLAKFMDSTGHLSETEATFSLTESSLISYSTLATITEDPAFAGTKLGLAVVSSALTFSGASAVDDITLVDSVANWDAEGGTATSGSYAFNTAANLGSSKVVRLFPSQRGINSDTGDEWDDRAALIDTWRDIDGAVIDDVESTLFVRTTTDNPAGTPTWSPWHELIGPADYTMWGAQFKLLFASGDQSHTRAVDKLSVTIKQ